MSVDLGRNCVLVTGIAPCSPSGSEVGEGEGVRSVRSERPWSRQLFFAAR
jgi:hypothetical protein